MPQIIIIIFVNRRFHYTLHFYAEYPRNNRPRIIAEFADKKRGKPEMHRTRTKYAKPFQTLPRPETSVGGRKGGKNNDARRSIVGSGHLFHLRGVLARAKDGTLHPRDIIIPNYFSISARRKERAA